MKLPYPIVNVNRYSALANLAEISVLREVSSSTRTSRATQPTSNELIKKKSIRKKLNQ
jgi:hypothetical protein